MSGRVHVLSGILSVGRRVRAVCSCGWTTTPRASTNRALTAFRDAHGSDTPDCALCGRRRPEVDYFGRPTQLRVLDVGSDADPRGQILVCHDLDQACMDGAAQRQLQLDAAALEGFGLQLPRPRLRVLPGGGR